MKKDLKKTIKQAEDHGWYLARNNKHMVYKHPEKSKSVTVSRSTVNTKALKRIRNNFGLTS